MVILDSLWFYNAEIFFFKFSTGVKAVIVILYQIYQTQNSPGLQEEVHDH